MALALNAILVSASFLITITHVIRGRPEKQMRRIDAQRRIAPMTDDKAFWNQTIR